MLKNLRLIVLDYPKLSLEEERTKRLMADLLQTKQISYHKTHPDFIPFTNLDLISTHIFIYDCTDPFTPQQVLGIRMCHENRCRKHFIGLPLESYFPTLPEALKVKIKQFRQGREIIDCGSMYADGSWKYKRKDFSLLEIGYLMMFCQIIRMGADNMLAATNERYKTSKSLREAGSFSRQNIFTHPLVNDPHLLILMDDINMSWIYRLYLKYRMVFENRIEIIPEETKNTLLSDRELDDLIELWGQNPQPLPFRKLSNKQRNIVAS